jgi:hypothetical protein
VPVASVVPPNRRNPLAQFLTVKAHKVQVGDTLAYGDLFGLVVTDVARKAGQVVITAGHRRNACTIPTDRDNTVDIFRD